ncbi:MAG: hypothetical protein ACYDAN_02530 [Candidatus Limnocylindrales bacterium]
MRRIVVAALAAAAVLSGCEAQGAQPAASVQWCVTAYGGAPRLPGVTVPPFVQPTLPPGVSLPPLPPGEWWAPCP